MLYHLNLGKSGCKLVLSHQPSHPNYTLVQPLATELF